MINKAKVTFLKMQGFTLIELLIVIAIIAMLTGVLVLFINPTGMLEKSRTATTETSLAEVAKAAMLFAEEKGYYPADVNRAIPNELSAYIGKVSWPVASFPGSVYDWDNWNNQTCWDGTTHIIQVTARQINDYKGKTNYTLYFVIQGPGIPHCSDSSVKGECINCVSRYP
jgi:prepilin-type N-terminal cleavage/methylation domain-containing protein